jgi:hypothetical protein
LRCPVTLCDIVVIDVFVEGTTHASSSSLGSWDIRHLEVVAAAVFSLLNGAGSLDVVVSHRVSDKLGRIGCHVLETLELIGWVQRVAGLTSGRKFVPLRLRASDIVVCQIVILLAQAAVKKSGSGSFDVKVVQAELWLVYILFSPHSGARASNICAFKVS